MSAPSSATDPDHGASRSEPDATARAAKLSSNEIESLRKQREEQTRIFSQAIKQYPDFPKPGILFEDIFPIFQSPPHHLALLDAFSSYITEISSSQNVRPDVLVGLDARGFLFAPTLALRLNCSFVPVRKQGKLPGPIETAEYTKEYGTDVFAMQSGAIKPGQNVLVLDDLIATGGSAAAAGELVKKNGGNLMGYLFMIELVGLKGREKLDAPVYTLIESQN